MHLSETALKCRSDLAFSKELVESLRQLLAELNNIVASKPKSVFDAKLAEYVFFPLSHVFRERPKLPTSAVELAVRCLDILLQTGWSKGLSPDLGLQLMIMLTFLAAVPSDSTRKLDTAEELRTSSMTCMSRLFRSLSRSQECKTNILRVINIPALGHAITVILEGSKSSSLGNLGLASLTTLQSLLRCVQEREVIASFFPGMISALTRVLSPSTNSRQPWRVLQLDLRIVEMLFDIVLADRHKIVPSEDKQEQTKGLNKAISIPRLDQEWLTKTASQVKLALSNIVKTQNHDRSEVRKALQQLCLHVLDSCSKSLSTAGSMMLETVLVLTQKDNSEDTRRRLRDMATERPSFTELLRSCLYNSLVAFPRVLLFNDDELKVRSTGQITISLDVLRSTSVDLSSLESTLLSTLQDGMSAASQNNAPNNAILESSGAMEMTSTSLTPKNTSQNRFIDFPMILASSKGGGNNASLLDEVVKELSGNSNAVTLAQSALDAARVADTSVVVTNFWISLNLLRHRFAHNGVVEDVLSKDSPSDQETGVREELYAFAINILSRSEDDVEIDWCLQVLSLEAVAFHAECQGQEFRPELADVLYPVLNLMGSQTQTLHRHAVICLNSMATSCGYDHAQDLIVSNADYLVNGIGVKLNNFDISPQTPQVLAMLVTMVGPRLLPYLDDITYSIFDALECFHGYPTLVELLFSVLRTITFEGVKTPALTIQGPHQHSHAKPPVTPTSMAEITARFRRRADRRASRERDLSPGETPQLPQQTPQQPWRDLRQPHPTQTSPPSHKEPEPEPEPVSTDEKPPPLTHTYRTLHRITLLTQHHLPSANPHARASLLTLLTHSLPYLAAHEDTFLPLVHTLWPILVPRLHDSEAYVVAGVLDALGAMCEGAGDFVAGRVDEIWPGIRMLWREAEGRVQRSERVAARGKKRAKAMRALPAPAPAPPVEAELELQVREAGPAGRLSSRELATITKPEAGSQVDWGSGGDAAGGREYVPTTTTTVRNALARFLLRLVSYVRVSYAVFDEILTVMLRDALVREGRGDVREALERRNADAVWLALEEARWDRTRLGRAGEVGLEELRNYWEGRRPGSVGRGPGFVVVEF